MVDPPVERASRHRAAAPTEAPARPGLIGLSGADHGALRRRPGAAARGLPRRGPVSAAGPIPDPVPGWPRLGGGGVSPGAGGDPSFRPCLLLQRLPLGTLQDLVAWVAGRRRRNPKAVRYRYARPHNRLRYGILLATLASALGGSLLIVVLLDPFSLFGRSARTAPAPGGGRGEQPGRPGSGVLGCLRPGPGELSVGGCRGARRNGRPAALGRRYGRSARAALLQQPLPGGGPAGPRLPALALPDPHRSGAVQHLRPVLGGLQGGMHRPQAQAGGLQPLRRLLRLHPSLPGVRHPLRGRLGQDP